MKTTSFRLAHTDKEMQRCACITYLNWVSLILFHLSGEDEKGGVTGRAARKYGVRKRSGRIAAAPRLAPSLCCLLWFVRYQFHPCRAAGLEQMDIGPGNLSFLMLQIPGVKYRISDARIGLITEGVRVIMSTPFYILFLDNY